MAQKTIGQQRTFVAKDFHTFAVNHLNTHQF